jgi:cytochrome b subunit of formate dehydrogenase
MRLFSEGVQVNNRILAYAAITNDKGCLACGNCVDSCPVARERRSYVFAQNMRTSMSLENIVGSECRRCYACVRACPQVSKSVKEYVTGFRRGEKVVHAYTATFIFLLAGTGIFMYHFMDFLPSWQQFGMKSMHTIAGFLLLMAPLLYFFLDRSHLRRALQKVFRYSSEDLDWLKSFYAYLKNPVRNSLPPWIEFNTYHKLWFAYLLIAVPAFGVTGIINLLADESSGSLLYSLALQTHILLAFATDLLVLVHIYFKVVRTIFRNISDMVKSYRTKGDLHFPFLYEAKSGNTLR